MSNVFLYVLLWLSFGVVHSLLTLSSVKNWLSPVFGSAYRLSYNLFSLLHVGVVILNGRQILGTERFQFLSSMSLGVFFLVKVCGVVLMLFALRQYDIGRFSGLSQWRSNNEQSNNRQKELASDEPLNESGLNRWVRHPLYTGAFLFLWGSAVSWFGFWTALFASVYLIIGSHFEERKLIELYGDRYVTYQSNVPAFFPGRKLKRGS